MPPNTSRKPAVRTQWLTLREAAEYARVSASIISRAVNDEKLSGVRLDPGNQQSPWRFTVADVDAWLERGRVKAAS